MDSTEQEEAEQGAQAEGTKRECAQKNEMVLVVSNQGPYVVTDRTYIPKEGEVVVSAKLLGGLEEGVLRSRMERSVREKGPDNPDTMECALNLALHLTNINKHAEALPLLRRDLAYNERMGEEGWPHGVPGEMLTASLHNLATTLRVLGQYEEAEALHIRSLDVSQRWLGHEHPTTIQMCGSLGCCYAAMGKNEDAIKMQRRVLEFNTRLLGAGHRQTVQSMSNLANTLLYSEDTRSEGLGLVRKALELNMRAHGLKSEITIASMLAVGTALGYVPDTVEAERLLRKAWEICKGLITHEHPLALRIIVSLAHVLSINKKYADLVSLCLDQQGIEVHEFVLGPDHPDTLTLQVHLAHALAQTGEHAQARVRVIRALEPCMRVLGPDHGTTELAALPVKKFAEAERPRRVVVMVQGRGTRGRR